MELAAARFTKNDIAKYPFLDVARKWIQIPDLKVEDLADPELSQIVQRAEERIEESILYSRVSRKLRIDEDIEITSYLVAIILAIATKDAFIKKRYALAEAKQAYEDLKKESRDKILLIARDYDWKLALNEDSTTPFEFMLNFVFYLKNTTHLKRGKWKLINRHLSKGNVYITRTEVARLLSEEIRKHIQERLEVQELPPFPQEINEITEKLKQLSLEKVGRYEPRSFPQTVIQTAFPPCVDALYKSASSGHHLSHIGRFTLTAFLVNIGMSSERIIELYKSFSDYNERMTRYQVEHIAGEKGSRTQYTPPKCSTLKTHGVCVNPDELCQRIWHPLAYYERKSHAS
ncbi:MAG: DNA primase large subunit PriL [Candidatus Bathyarchaeota archaeon]|jgi:DNA primase large subunit